MENHFLSGKRPNTLLLILICFAIISSLLQLLFFPPKNCFILYTGKGRKEKKNFIRVGSFFYIFHSHFFFLFVFFFFCWANNVSSIHKPRCYASIVPWVKVVVIFFFFLHCNILIYPNEIACFAIFTLLQWIKREW